MPKCHAFKCISLKHETGNHMKFSLAPFPNSNMGKGSFADIQWDESGWNRVGEEVSVQQVYTKLIQSDEQPPLTVLVLLCNLSKKFSENSQLRYLWQKHQVHEMKIAAR